MAHHGTLYVTHYQTMRLSGAKLADVNMEPPSAEGNTQVICLPCLWSMVSDRVLLCSL